jgi:hypothetical protein
MAGPYLESLTERLITCFSGCGARHHQMMRNSTVYSASYVSWGPWLGQHVSEESQSSGRIVSDGCCNIVMRI